jgi:hypothetical protein
MVEILSKFLVADNVVIRQGTKELREAFRNPEVIPALCNVVCSSENPRTRQCAAVLLRKRLSKNKFWTKQPVNVQNGTKQGILHALVNEPEKSVKNSIALFIGTIAIHDFCNQSWPELTHFLPKYDFPNQNWPELMHFLPKHDFRNQSWPELMHFLPKHDFRHQSWPELMHFLPKYDFRHQSWPELIHFLQQLTTNDNISPKELGMYALSVVSEVARKQFLPYAMSAAFLLSNTQNSWFTIGLLHGPQNDSLFTPCRWRTSDSEYVSPAYATVRALIVANE